jgi:hypothetical protein
VSTLTKVVIATAIVMPLLYSGAVTIRRSGGMSYSELQIQNQRLWRAIKDSQAGQQIAFERGHKKGWMDGIAEYKRVKAKTAQAAAKAQPQLTTAKNITCQPGTQMLMTYQDAEGNQVAQDDPKRRTLRMGCVLRGPARE